MLIILELANEVIRGIFEHLSALDLAVAAQTCRRFRDICRIDDLWRRRCIQGKLSAYLETSLRI